MKIKLKLFSGLMEYLPPQAEGNVLEISLPGSITAHGLLDRYNVPRKEAQVVMKNGEFLPLDQRDLALNDGDVISVWPAIQGG
jgi:sulfur carrier protein ThiS